MFQNFKTLITKFAFLLSLIYCFPFQHLENDVFLKWRFSKAYEASYGTKGVFSPSNWIGPRGMMKSCSITNTPHMFYLFGGNSGQHKNDLWVFDSTIEEWAWISGNQTNVCVGNYVNQGEFSENSYPGSRQNYGMSCINNLNEIYIYGGSGWFQGSIFGLLDDMWAYSITMDKWKYINGSLQADQIPYYGQKGVSGASLIGGLDSFTQISFDHDNTIYFFGGMTKFEEYSNHLFMYNITNDEVTYVDGQQFGNVLYSKKICSNKTRIGRRVSASGWRISDNEFYIFSGKGYDASFGLDHLNDLWTFNTELECWRWISGNSEKNLTEIIYPDKPGTVFKSGKFPLPRSGHGSFYFDGMLYVFGGFQLSNYYNADLVVYSFSNDEWWFIGGSHLKNRYTVYHTTEFSLQNLIGSRAYHGFHVVSDNFGLPKLYVFGGVGYNEIDGNVLLGDMALITPIKKCLGIEEYERIVCNGFGRCVNHNYCDCFKGHYGRYCEISKCGEHFSNSTDVCSSNGVCMLNGKCRCMGNYKGARCSVPVCYGILGNNSNAVCSSNGVCIAGGLCQCNYGWEGNVCSNKNVLFVALDYWWVFFGIVLIIILIVIISLVIVSIFVVIVRKQRRKLNKFGEIDDIDLILEEQRVLKDTSKAKIVVNTKLFEVPFRDLKVIKRIGSPGISGTVFLVEYKGAKAAFKCFRVDDFLEQDKFSQFEREVELLSGLRFPYIVNFLGASVEKGRVGIILEYCESGDLSEFIKNYKKENGGVSFPRNEKLRMLKEICLAMKYIHSHKVIFRDLKMENVLVTKLYHAKITDFGLSKIQIETSTTQTKRIGTSFYIAPEILTGKYSFECDVFSFAMLSYVFLTEIFNLFGKTYSKVENKIASDPNFRPTNFSDMPKELENMIKRCWKHDPSERMAFSEIVECLEKEIGNEGGSKISEDQSERVKILEKELKEKNEHINSLQKKLEEFKTQHLK